MEHNVKVRQIQDSIERLEALLAAQVTDIKCVYLNPIASADALRRVEVMQREVRRLRRLVQAQQPQ